MDKIAIPLAIIMILGIIFYTISVFMGVTKKTFTKGSLALMHLSVLLVIIGIFYMTGISSKLPYHNVSYGLMDMHQAVGCITLILMIIHAIIATIVRRKNKSLMGFKVSKKFNIFSIILWIISIVFYLMALYIGILAALN